MLSEDKNSFKFLKWSGVPSRAAWCGCGKLNWGARTAGALTWWAIRAAPRGHGAVNRNIRNTSTKSWNRWSMNPWNIFLTALKSALFWILSLCHSPTLPRSHCLDVSQCHLPEELCCPPGVFQVVWFTKSGDFPADPSELMRAPLCFLYRHLLLLEWSSSTLCYF